MQGILDQKTDLYALGITLFELTTGRRPFLSNSLADMLGEHIQGQAPHLSTIRADVPRYFQDFVHQLILKNPDRRYASASEALTALNTMHQREQSTLNTLGPDEPPTEIATFTPWLIVGFVSFGLFLTWLMLA